MQSSVFKLDHSEELKLEDLHLTNKEKLQSTPAVERVYVGTLQEIKKPFLQQIKPYLQSFLSGAATTASHAATYGQKALSAIGGALWWSYEGIKGLFNKTAQYIQPKFVLITSKMQIKNKEQLNTLDKITKDVAVLGLDEFKELQPVQNGKFQVAIPMDEDFINYLRNQKIDIKQKEWEPNLQPTKTMIVPSQSFSVLLQDLKQNNVPVKIANNYGGFCTFEFEGKNEIQYECINKLKLDKEHLEGYLMPMPAKVESIKSNSSSEGFDNEAQITNSNNAVPQVAEAKSVEAVPLIQEYQLSSDTIKLDYV